MQQHSYCAAQVSSEIDLLQEVMLGFMRILEKVYKDDPEAQAKAVGQLQQFRTMQGLFGRPSALLAADGSKSGLNPHAWWNIYGSCTPELQTLAIQVLAQVFPNDCY